MRQHVARTGEVVRAALDRDHGGDRGANAFELATMANANL